MDKKFSFCSNEGNRTHLKNWMIWRIMIKIPVATGGRGELLITFARLQHISSDNVKRPQIKTEIQTVA